MAEHEGDNEDARREAALASSTALQFGFRSSKVTQAQLDKLKELHQKRLALKEKSNVKQKHKGSSGEIAEVCKYNLSSQSYEEAHLGCKSDNSNLSKLVEISNTDETIRSPSLKKRKLHWGLDAKERWERKANM